jgi:uncharacterized OsmC-like protein
LTAIKSYSARTNEIDPPPRLVPRRLPSVERYCSMLEYEVTARRVDEHGSLALCKEASILLDTDIAGRRDAFNPAELFLAAIAACMIKGIERVAPMIHFKLARVEVRLKAVRQDAPPRIVSVDYELLVETSETDQRLELLHTNVRKYGTISNTVAEATRLRGVIRKA